MMLLNLGSAALMAGEMDEARPVLAEALQIAGQIDDRVAQFCLLAAFGVDAALSGRARLAARLLGTAETARALGTAETARALVGASRVLFLGYLLAEARQATACALGVATFEGEFSTGKGLSRDAALGLALGQSAPAAASAGAGPLGNREADVARLVAEGLEPAAHAGRSAGWVRTA